MAKLSNPKPVTGAAASTSAAATTIPSQEPAAAKTTKPATKSAFPIFTPTRVTRAYSEKMQLAPIDFGLPGTASKKTRIPAGVGLESLPSPRNLRGRAVADVDDAIVRLGKLGLSEEQKKGGEKDNEDKVTSEPTGKKKTRKARKDAKEEILDLGTEEMKPVKKWEEKHTRTTRSKSSAATKSSKQATIIEESDDEADAFFELNPVVPRSLRQGLANTKKTARVRRKKVEVVETSGKDDASNKNTSKIPSDTSTVVLATASQKSTSLLLSLKNLTTSSSTKKLWDIDADDIAELKRDIEIFETAGRSIGSGADDGESRVINEKRELLEGMLDVMVTFQAFRSSLDGYLERVEGVGLELDWDARVSGGDGESEEVGGGGDERGSEEEE